MLLAACDGNIACKYFKKLRQEKMGYGGHGSKNATQLYQYSGNKATNKTAAGDLKK